MSSRATGRRGGWKAVILFFFFLYRSVFRSYSIFSLIYIENPPLSPSTTIDIYIYKFLFLSIYLFLFLSFFHISSSPPVTSRRHGPGPVSDPYVNADVFAILAPLCGRARAFRTRTESLAGRFRTPPPPRAWKSRQFFSGTAERSPYKRGCSPSTPSHRDSRRPRSGGGVSGIISFPWKSLTPDFFFSTRVFVPPTDFVSESLTVRTLRTQTNAIWTLESPESRIDADLGIGF